MSRSITGSYDCSVIDYRFIAEHRIRVQPEMLVITNYWCIIEPSVDENIHIVYYFHMTCVTVRHVSSQVAMNRHALSAPSVIVEQSHNKPHNTVHTGIRISVRKSCVPVFI